MASKQLGKLRQWAGEVISSKDKTTVTEEFRDLERDIELRKDGAQRLLLASESYHHVLSKKRDNEALDDAEKLLPIDALGIVMIVHGEEFGEDSAFGTSLVKLGRAHCQVATLQEAYALTFQDTFVASVTRFGEDIKEYEVQRKKLESRRLSYDAAITKFEKLKSSKKEKDKREAEEDMERAQERYEETSEDVRAHMHAIQEKEMTQLRDLTSFLDLEINFVEQYLNVLKDVKSDWYDESGVMQVEPPRGEGPTHIFSRSPKTPKYGSMRSQRSQKTTTEESDSSDDENVLSNTSKGIHRKTDSNGVKTSSRPPSRPPSRPSSRMSRKRSDSTGTVGGKEEKEKAEKVRKLSVAGWASSAVDSVTGRGKKNKDKEKFTALGDDDEGRGKGEEKDVERNHKLNKSRSSLSVGRKSPKPKSELLLNGSPKLPPRIQKPPSLQGKKVVRALYDFTGSSDELTFKAGDDIVVVNEVIDGWWMGDLDGKRGLFPTPYVEVISTKPGRAHRSSEGDVFSNGDGFSSEQQSSTDTEDYGASDIDEDSHLRAHVPVAEYSPFDIGAADTISITSSVAEEEEKRELVPKPKPTNENVQTPSRTRDILQSLNLTQHSPTILRSTTTDNSTSLTKKGPPPPPPRRPNMNSTATGPPIPERRPTAFRTQSSSPRSLPKFMQPPTSSVSNNGHGYDTSPFDSVTEVTTAQIVPLSRGCTQFVQHPFKPQGMCSNCFVFHG